jgi:hypothetical protein
MIKRILLFSLIFSPLLTFAQYRLEFGVAAGAANYLGEMGGKEKTRRNFIYDIKLGQTRTATGAFVRYKLSPALSLRGQFTWGRVAGADSLSKNRGRVGRNLSFRNDLYEITGLIDYFFYTSNDVARVGGKRLDFRSYVFAGAGAFIHNPKAKYNGEWVDLRPLQTEGVAYDKVEVTIPAGLGIQYTLGRKLKLGMEVGWRTTFTDYIDDVSTYYVVKTDPLESALANRSNETNSENAADPVNYIPGTKRGDPTHNDSYLFTTLNFSYALRGKNSFYKSKYNYITGVRRKMKKRRVRAKF